MKNKSGWEYETIMWIEMEVPVKVRWNVSPEQKETGPSMDNAGGEPRYPACVEDVDCEFDWNTELHNIMEVRAEEIVNDDLLDDLMEFADGGEDEPPNYNEDRGDR